MYNKLVLGTAQFGLDYGISNTAGKTHAAEVFKILSTAENLGIKMLDTAFEYGDSQSVIGEYIQQTSQSFNIISKSAAATVSTLESEIEASMHQLHTDVLYGCMLHSFSHYQRCPELFTILLDKKNSGKIKKIGFSLYYPHELEALFEHDISFDIIQIPFNVFDRRFASHFPELQKRGVEVHCRSIFLQGLFFLNPETLPRHFELARPRLLTLRRLASISQIPLNCLCILAAAQEKAIQNILIGVTSANELTSNCEYLQYQQQFKKIESEIKTLRYDNEQIILPIHWKT